MPDGIPYTPKLFLLGIKRLVNHFKLKEFTLLAHSYGVMLSTMYATVFPDEVKAIVAIDWVMSGRKEDLEPIAKHWRMGINRQIEVEDGDEGTLPDVKRSPLTKELAVKLLMNANHHLDETAAKCLLERALITKSDGTLDFSRDVMFKASMSRLGNHFSEYSQIWPNIKTTLKAPMLQIYAHPPSYGDFAFECTNQRIRDINENSKTKIELVKFDGTHHFHMIHPAETAKIVLKFLDKIKDAPKAKL